jgi:uncharacterized membrane protein
MKTEIYLIPENFKDTFIKFIISFILLIVFDFIYLNISYKLYPVTKSNINYLSAILSWFLIAYIITIHESSSIQHSILYGIIMGLIIYGVFNLVNFAILKEWKLNIVIIDTLWGMTVCGLTSICLYLLNN